MATSLVNKLSLLLIVLCLKALSIPTMVESQFLPPFLAPFLPIPNLPGLSPPQQGGVPGLSPPQQGGVPGLFPFPGGDNIQKCWAALLSAPGCLIEVGLSLLRGQIGSIGTACCHTITGLKDNCLPRMFPLNPLFPPLLTGFCSAGGSSGSAPISLEDSKLLVIQSSWNKTLKCWSPLTHIDGCFQEIYAVLSSNKFDGIGSACCEAIEAIDDKCWPKMIPFNPFFPPLIKKSCSGIAPSPN